MSVELPTKLPDPPRLVIRRDAGCFLAGAYVIVVVFCLLALVPAGWMVMTLVYALGGTETTGTTAEIVAVSKARSIDFEYFVGGKKYNDFERVSLEVMLAQKARNDAGDKTVKVRYLHFAGLSIAGLPEHSSVWWMPGRALLFLGIAAAVVWLLIWAAFKFPKYDKDLVMYGLTTPGAIIGKRTRTHSKGGVTYLVDYLYTGPSGAQWQGGQMIRGKKRWEAIQVGEVFTVMVDPKDEKKSVIYEFCLYKIRETPLTALTPQQRGNAGGQQ